MSLISGRRATLTAALVFSSCAVQEQADTDTVAASSPYAEVAGTWNMRSLDMSDSVLVTYEIVATGDSAGWTLNFPGRPPIPIHVLSVTADSVILDAGPYASAIRQNVTVATRFDLERRGDSLSGLITAVYNLPEGETTVPLRVEGTRSR